MGSRVALLTPSVALPCSLAHPCIASIAGNLARSACRVALPCSLAHPCGVASLRDMRQHYEHASLAPRPSGIASMLTCSPLQGSVAQSYCLGGGGLGEKNLRPGHRPILRSQPFSSQPARFLPLRLSPPLPLLLCSRNAATLLFFLSALVLVNFLGMA